MKLWLKDLDISTKLKYTWFSNIKELYITDVLFNEEGVNMVTIVGRLEGSPKQIRMDATNKYIKT
jgi:hypothetical protein